MFNKVSYRRGVIEGVILYTLGRLGALITPAFFPPWMYVLAPLLFLALQFLIAPYWATRRIKSTKRERLSKRFWVLGPLMAAICFCIDLIVSLTVGLALFTFEGVQQGPAIMRFFTNGSNHLSLLQFGIYELRSAALLLSFFTLTVICTRLAQGGFLRFTMPAGGNRVTL
jgi:predicted lysophospholipase L1 biosynthesis ABC-type transport system permease subunit